MNERRILRDRLISNDMANDRMAGSPPGVSSLRFRGLSKRYGDVTALRNLNLNVREGEVYGFLGRNGAGKSTALRIAMGITRATSGEVALFGQTTSPGDPAAKRAIGYVAQEQSFYDWMTATSIGRFVSGFYPSWDDAEYARLLAQLEVPLRRKLNGFSGGMRAKLALALALAHRPRLLLLDEPTAGMDAVARREFIEIVRDHAKRTHRTTVFSSHLIDEVEIAADTLGIVHEGRMLYEGSVHGLRQSVRSLTKRTDGELMPVLACIDLGQHAGIEVLQDRISDGERCVVLRALEPDGFDALDVCGWQVQSPSLEDIFVAMVTRSVKL